MTSTRDLREQERREGYAACMLALTLARELTDALERTSLDTGETAETSRMDALTFALSDVFDVLGERYGFDPAQGNRNESIVTHLKAARDWSEDKTDDEDYEASEGIGDYEPDAYLAGKAAAYADAVGLLYGEPTTLYSETERA